MKIALCGFAGSGKDTLADHLVANHSFTKVPFARPLKRVTGTIFGLTDDQMNKLELKEAPLLEHRWPFVDRTHLEHTVVEGVKLVYDLSTQHIEDPAVSQQRLDRFPYEPPALLVKGVLLNFHRVIYPTLFNNYTDPRPTLSPTPRLLLQLIGTEVFRAVNTDTWVEAWKREALRHDRVVATDCRFPNEVGAVRRLGGGVWRVDSNHPWVKRDTKHVSEREFQTFVVDHVVSNTGTVEKINAQADKILASVGT